MCLSPSRIILAFGILLMILVLALLFSCVLWFKARGQVIVVGNLPVVLFIYSGAKYPVLITHFVGSTAPAWTSQATPERSLCYTTKNFSLHQSCYIRRNVKTLILSSQISIFKKYNYNIIVQYLVNSVANNHSQNWSLQSVKTGSTLVFLNAIGSFWNYSQ